MSEMSNEAWEVVQCIKMYRKKALEVLTNGGGINDLAQITDMGMHLRIAAFEEEVILILAQEVSVEEKAQLIAEKLIAV